MQHKNLGTGKTITKEAAGYLMCGVLSMAISWAAMLAVNAVFFGGTAYPTPVQNSVLGLANWTAGMLSAFFLTRRFVFRSDGNIVHELAKHAGSRIVTLLMEQALRQLFGAAGFDLYLTTLAVTGVSTAANYVLAKLFVFRKKSHETDPNKNAQDC